MTHATSTAVTRAAVTTLPAAVLCDSLAVAAWLALTIGLASAVVGLMRWMLRSRLPLAAEMAALAIVAAGMAIAMNLAGTAVLPDGATQSTSALLVAAASAFLTVASLDQAEVSPSRVLARSLVASGAALALALVAAMAHQWLSPAARPAAVLVTAGLLLTALTAARGARRPDHAETVS